MVMKIEANSVEEYLKAIPEERKVAFKKLRKTILENLPEGFVEELNFGMIGYVVPLSIYPSGYHTSAGGPLPFCNLGSQKHFIGFYHMGLYSDPALQAWFMERYEQDAKSKLDMGKSCVRLKKMDDIPYDLIGELISKITPEDWIATYESNRKK